MPFGELPPHFGEPPPAAPSKDEAQTLAEQQRLAKQINMSCINITPDGSTAIGFTDLGEKPPQNYYLLVGASAGGWTVLQADYDEEWAQIEKSGVAITLKLGAGLIEAPPVPAAVPSAATGVARVAPPEAGGHASAATESAGSGASGRILRPSLGGRPSVNVASLQRTREEHDRMREELKRIQEEGGDVKSYMERLLERRRQEKSEKEAAEEQARANLQELARKITQDELAKREREINLSLIEQGAKPVSDIVLTPEEEAALVERGILAQ